MASTTRSTGNPSRGSRYGPGGSSSTAVGGGNATTSPIDGAMRTVHPSFSDNGTLDSNLIINSRYTALNFIFLNLYEQFRRPLNLYFLFVAMLQFISVIAPVSPFSTFLPLLFAFLLTAAKEGYDDLRRHRQDRVYNQRMYSVLRDGTWRSVPSKDIAVGDLLRLQNNDEIPADCLAVSCPRDAHNVVYIRTDNMDGEIDLKPRDVVPLASLRAQAPDVVAEGTTAATAVTSSPRSSQVPPKGPEAATAALFLPDAPVADMVRALQAFAFDVPAPSAVVDAFDGRVSLGNAQLPLAAAHLLPQSCYIKHTASLVAIVVYTGPDTKASMNKHKTPIKWAKIDRDISRYSIFIFIAQIATAITLGVIGFVVSQRVDHYWYLKPPASESVAAAVFIYPLRFFLLTTVMIPISFKFVVDISKYYMALAIEWDLNMYDAELDEGAKVRNSAILEDLGQCEYILSDKTGTMTQNVMEMREASIFGQRVLVRTGTGSETDVVLASPPATPRRPDADNFFWEALALCNTVEVSGFDSGVEYSAASPDEEALCRAAAAHGARLISRSKSDAVVVVKGVERRYKIHHVFPFSSEKKCMSVLVERVGVPAEGSAPLLITKGADDKLLQLLGREYVASAAGAALSERLVADLRAFASEGLRTLVLCSRTLSAEQASKAVADHAAAMLVMEGRAERVEAVRSAVEKDLELIGATAIEDKLQVGVVQTMGDLLDANIKIWMLTGDKVETAEQIAVSCGLVATTDRIIRVTGDRFRTHLLEAPMPMEYRRRRAGATSTPNPSLTKLPRSTGSADPTPLSDAPLTQSRYSACGDQHSAEERRSGSAHDDHPSTSLVIQGGAVLDAVLAEDDLREKFTLLSMRCKSVVCARVTPLQKAKVTALVRAQGKMTVAIGDGGNDVAMIQEAHVGIGIVGREGKQASRASDFSIARFRFLRTLLLVHGHQSYMRTAYVVQYSFYKSMLISFIQLVFNMTVTLMSGVSFWNSWALTAWNGVYTLPQTIFYVFDRVAPRVVLEDNPFLYRLPQRGYGMTKITFAGYLLRGIVQSVVGIWLIYFIFSDQYIGDNGTGETADTNFTIAYTAFIWLQLLTVVIESHAIGPLNALALFGMPALYYLISDIYSSIDTLAFYGVFRHTLTSTSHMAALFICIALFVPHMLHIAVERCFFPTAVDVLRMDEVHRLSSEGHSIGLSKNVHLTARNFVSQLLLALEVIARIMITPEEEGEEQRSRNDRTNSMQEIVHP